MIVFVCFAAAAELACCECGSYEPASALLARIRAERESSLATTYVRVR